MQVRISQSRLDSIAEDNCGDSDGSWWIQSQIEHCLETLLDLINEDLFEKDQIVLVPEDKYLKCTCEFKKRYDGDKRGDVFDHITFCDEHLDEKPFTEQDHIDNCPECQMNQKMENC